MIDERCPGCGRKVECNICDHQESVSLRDQMAMAALTGITSNPYAASVIGSKGSMDDDMLAKTVYEIADAMLLEREKDKTKGEET